jgi:O-antigen/teichoic acid export membrane protein
MKFMSWIIATLRKLQVLIQTRFGKNVLANYLGSFAVVIVPMLVLPFLLRALGPAMWGLVIFCTFLLAALTAFNSGISQALQKEFGARWADSLVGQHDAKAMLANYELVYWLASILGGICLFLFSRTVATNWLNLGEVDIETATSAIECASVLLIFQLPLALYKTVLFSAQQQVKLNVVQTAFAITRSICGLLAAQFTGSILVYLLVTTFTVALEVVIFAYIAWSLMPDKRRRVVLEFSEFRKTAKFSGAMSIIVLAGVITTFVDRFYVSALLEIHQLGIYGIAVSLSLGALHLIYPLLHAAMPQLAAQGANDKKRNDINYSLFKTVTVLVGLVAVVYLVAGKYILSVWLGDQQLSLEVYPVLNLLLISSALNCFYNIIYINWVSLAQVKWIAAVNSISLLLAVVITPITISQFGLLGAAIAFNIVNMAGVIFGGIWLYKRKITMASI